MKKVLLLSALAFLFLSLPSAKADVFRIHFDGGPLGVDGLGDFFGVPVGPDQYQIISVIYDLLPNTVTDPAFGSSTIVAISDYAGSDNLLFYPSPEKNHFDSNGLSFFLANGVQINLFDFTVGGTTFSAALETNPNGDITELVNETVSRVTPEPSSLILLGTSVLAGTGILRRRRSA